MFRRKTVRRLRRKLPRRARRARRYKITRPIGRSHVFVRAAFFSTITSAAAVPVFGGYQFALTDLPNSSEFTNLFDEYMIAKVSVMFMPNKLTLNTNTAITTPYFLTVIDKDDAATPSSVNDLVQYPNCRFTSGNKRLVLTFKPRHTFNLYNGGVTDGYATRQGFIDCSNAGVPHYGVKFALEQSATASAYQYAVWVRYTIICRGVR